MHAAITISVSNFRSQNSAHFHSITAVKDTFPFLQSQVLF